MRHDVLVPDPTLVLLHGQPDSSASFWALRRALRARLNRRVRIAVPDRPGYGANPLAATDFAGNASWLGGWLRRFGAGPVVVVGHSWAGGAAAMLAASEPGALAGLVLMASIGPSCLLGIDRVLAAPALGELISFGMLGIGRRPVSSHAASILTHHLSEADAPYAWASGAAMQHRPIWRSFLSEQRALVSQLDEVNAALPSIAVPTLVLTGNDDQVIPRRTAQALTSMIPGARKVEIEGGHDLQLRQPEAAAKAIDEFAHPLLDPS
jgi:pimeloyl-ACP methyl ester carboxylesterase